MGKENIITIIKIVLLPLTLIGIGLLTVAALLVKLYLFAYERFWEL